VSAREQERCPGRSVPSPDDTAAKRVDGILPPGTEVAASVRYHAAANRIIRSGRSDAEKRLGIVRLNERAKVDGVDPHLVPHAVDGWSGIRRMDLTTSWSDIVNDINRMASRDRLRLLAVTLRVEGDHEQAADLELGLALADAHEVITNAS
jgi:hypothetical protein